jgi:hypothetical protein
MADILDKDGHAVLTIRLFDRRRQAVACRRLLIEVNGNLSDSCFSITQWFTGKYALNFHPHAFLASESFRGIVDLFVQNIMEQ